MLPGIGGSEIVVIAVIALLVVGPKDLPKMLRQLGRFVGKMRAMADDFRSSFEDMARQSELDDLRKEVEALRTNQVPVLDDVRTEIGRIESDVNQSLTPNTHYYSDADTVTSPDAMDFVDPAVPETPTGDLTPDNLPAPELAQPKKPRARSAAKPRAAKTPGDDSAPALKRTRSKGKTS